MGGFGKLTSHRITLSSHTHAKEKALKNRASVRVSIEGKKKKRTTTVIRFFFL